MSSGEPSRGAIVISADERAVLSAVLPNYGNRTFGIAARVKRTTAFAYRVLRKMERLGLVARNERYTYVNDIYWDRTSAGDEVVEGRRASPESSTLPGVVEG